MQKKSYVYIVAAAVLWGTIGIFVKTLQAIGFTSMEIVAIRVGVSAVVMFAYLFFTDRKLLKINIRDCGYFIGTGILSLVLFNWCFFTTMKISSISVATVLLYTSPIFVVLMSALLFGEKLTKPKIIALMMTFLGCVLVTGVLRGGGDSLSAIGILTGVGSGFWYAMYSIFGRYALKKYHPSTVSAYTFIFAAIGALPLARLDKQFELLALPTTIICAIGIGIICCMLPFMFYTKGLVNIETGKAAIIATLEPAVATLIGVFVYSENITADKFAGMLMILIAILLLNKKVPEKSLTEAE